MDAAHLQEEEAQRRKRHRRNQQRGKHDKDANGPLYSVFDTLNSFDRFGRTAHYGKPIKVARGIEATFGDAGHILGSAWIFLNLEEDGKTRRVLFSGDLGNSGRPVLRDPDTAPETDYLLIETTYGDRLHRSFDDSVTELYDAINDTIKRGGNAVIPTFALDRAQELLYMITEGEKTGRLPKGLSVFLDSPMAIAATEVYSRYPDCYRSDLREMFGRGRDPFHPAGLTMVRETAESMNLNNVSGAVILAGSGMCTGGRVRHHLVHNVGREDSSIIFVGYAARGTPARRIIDGAKTIRLFGDECTIKARTYTINGFSAHADQSELLAWEKTAKPKHICLVHGEEKSMAAMAAKLNGRDVRMPKLHQTIEL
jgi:metallo-beta-lactamase family protein